MILPAKFHMLLKVLLKFELLAANSTFPGGARLMDSHVEIPLTIHLEPFGAPFPVTRKVFAQNMNYFLMVSQLILVSESFMAVFKIALKHPLWEVNCEVAFEGGGGLEGFGAEVAGENVVGTDVAGYVPQITVLLAAIETFVRHSV